MFTLKIRISSEWIASGVRGPYRAISFRNRVAFVPLVVTSEYTHRRFRGTCSLTIRAANEGMYRHKMFLIILCSRFQRPRGLRGRPAAARLLRLWFRISPGAWMFVCCECCVLSGRGLCDEVITRPEESYRLWCVAVCDLETS